MMTKGRTKKRSRKDQDEEMIEEAITHNTRETARFRKKFTEERNVPEELAKELDRLLKLPTKKGSRMLDLVREFNKFPWAQDTVLAALKFEEVLHLFLQRYMGISGEVLRRWTDEGILHQSALLGLATYEACHRPGVRPDIEVLINEYKAQAWTAKKDTRGDAVGDSLVESTRQLSGKLEKPSKPKRPKPLSTDGGKKGKGRGIGKRGREKSKKPQAPRKIRKLETIDLDSKLQSLPPITAKNIKRRSRPTHGSQRSNSYRERSLTKSKSNADRRSMGSRTEKMEASRRRSRDSGRVGSKRRGRELQYDARRVRMRSSTPRQRSRSRSTFRERRRYTTRSSEERNGQRRRVADIRRDRERRGSPIGRARKKRRSSPSRSERNRTSSAMSRATNLLLNSLLEKLTSTEVTERLRTRDLGNSRPQEHGHVEDLYRKDLIAAVRRLPDGDAWKAKILSSVNITDTSTVPTRAGAQKATRENFRRWLAAPESAAPFDLTKIFKSLGYTMDLTQENLPPAVPVILISLILSEAQNAEQSVRAAKWFLKVGEEAFRFRKANQTLEFIRRAL